MGICSLKDAPTYTIPKYVSDTLLIERLHTFIRGKSMTTISLPFTDVPFSLNVVRHGQYECTMTISVPFVDCIHTFG